MFKEDPENIGLLISGRVFPKTLTVGIFLTLAV